MSTPSPAPVPAPALLANGWPALVIPPCMDTIIVGVRGNAIGADFRVSHKIGSGSFGDIYMGSHNRTHERVAIKIERCDATHPQLMKEYDVYSAIKHNVGVPHVIWRGSNRAVHIMVMELLGESLEQLFTRCGRHFSLKTLTMLAIQLLHRIEHQHEQHYLHRDIKPDNFVMGPPASTQSHVLFTIDHGLSTPWRDPQTLAAMPFAEDKHKQMIGTPRFASLNTHHGIRQCRRDDIESIGYMLIYFFRGRLPWQNLPAATKKEKYQKIAIAKAHTTIDHLCAGAPPAFRTLLAYARSLSFVQRPDYKFLRSLFYDMYREKEWADDCIYDWMLLPGAVTAAAAAARVASSSSFDHAPAAPAAHATAAAAAAAAAVVVISDAAAAEASHAVLVSCNALNALQGQHIITLRGELVHMRAQHTHDLATSAATTRQMQASIDHWQLMHAQCAEEVSNLRAAAAISAAAVAAVAVLALVSAPPSMPPSSSLPSSSSSSMPPSRSSKQLHAREHDTRAARAKRARVEAALA